MKMQKSFKVRITKPNGWYANEIGKIFEVYDAVSYYTTIPDGNSIEKNDCEVVINDPQQMSLLEDNSPGLFD